jgi:hypothetical protein
MQLMNKVIIPETPTLGKWQAQIVTVCNVRQFSIVETGYW